MYLLPQYATSIQVSSDCYSFMIGISSYNSQLTPVYFLHTEKRVQPVLPNVFFMVFPTSPFEPNYQNSFFFKNILLFLAPKCLEICVNCLNICVMPKFGWQLDLHGKINLSLHLFNRTKYITLLLFQEKMPSTWKTLNRQISVRL